MMNNIKNLFRRNLPIKIMAVIGAVILWCFVMNEENPSVNSTFTVPIYTINEPDNFQIDMSEREITLRVRAPRASFTAVKTDDFKAYVDLAEAVEGQNTLKVRTVVPKGFEMLELSEPDVTVTLEAIISKEVAVDVQITGNTGAGSALEKIEFTQKNTAVKGPRSGVDSVVKVVGYMSLGNNTTDVSNRVKLSPLDEDGDVVENVELSPDEIDVTAKIMNGVEKKLVQINPVHSGTPARQCVITEVSVQPDRLEIIGKTELLNDINVINTEDISVEGAGEDVTQEVNLDLPEGVIAPSRRVTVKISIGRNLQEK